MGWTLISSSTPLQLKKQQQYVTAPRCFPGLTFPDFDLAPKRNVWLLRTGFGIAPVNKMVSLTWLLWALMRSFGVLHYITDPGLTDLTDPGLIGVGTRVMLMGRRVLRLTICSRLV